MHIITSKCRGICHTSRSDKSHSYKTGWFLLFRTPHPGLLKMAVFCPAFQSSFFTSALSLFQFVPVYLCSHYLFTIFPQCYCSFLFFNVGCSMSVLDHSYSLSPSCGWSLAWSLHYLCHLYMSPPRQRSLTYPEDACTPDSDCLHSYKGCVFCSLSVGAIEGQQCVPGFSK